MARPTELFPAIEPYEKDYLYTPDGHQVYFERCGNPKGKPVVYIPGGPGVGCAPKDRCFFDPEKWDILLVDLRGSGQSRPLGKIAKNTTQLAVEDIYNINRRFGRKKTVVWGGSWGSTLGSIYAITHPETVSGMVLRGIFLGEKHEIRSYFAGQAATSEYGKLAFERFMAHVPLENRNDPVGYYYHQMQPESPKHRRMLYSYEWARFEECLLYKEPKDEATIEKEIKSIPFEAWALMEAHYFAHGCFIEDGYIINSAKTGKFPNVRIIIVQGKDDLICPPMYAKRLYEALPNSILHLVEGGHSSREPEILKTLISETDALWDRI